MSWSDRGPQTSHLRQLCRGWDSSGFSVTGQARHGVSRAMETGQSYDHVVTESQMGKPDTVGRTHVPDPTGISHVAWNPVKLSCEQSGKQDCHEYKNHFVQNDPEMAQMTQFVD